MANAKKLVRLLWLYNYLCAGNVVCTDAMAVRLGVSQRAIQRDLRDLQGAPLYVPLIREGGGWKWISDLRSR
jgi:predicted DNA-binding transcriptional regulator YafY